MIDEEALPLLEVQQEEVLLTHDTQPSVQLFFSSVKPVLDCPIAHFTKLACWYIQLLSLLLLL